MGLTSRLNRWDMERLQSPRLFVFFRLASMEVFPSWVVSAVADGYKEFKSSATKILELKNFIHILQRFETRNFASFFAITMKLAGVFSPSISCSVVHVAPCMSHSTASGISNWNLTHLAQLEACNVTWHHCVWHRSEDRGPDPVATIVQPWNVDQ